jgi:alpha-L-rhamnosidase
MAVPIGIDDDPTFAWQVTDPRPGATQTAYRVVVSLDRSVRWDSGQVRSGDELVSAPPGALQLAADSRYTWTVQTWDGDGVAGPPSAPATFDTGLHDADWVAKWIRRSPASPEDAADDYTYARREITPSASPITRAVAYVSAGQQYQLHVNGRQVDAGPAFGYPDAAYDQATDLTAALKPGVANAVGVLYHSYGYGKGRPAMPAGAIVQLSLTHADGSHEVFGTDGGWTVARAPWLAGTPRNLEGDPVDETENIDGNAVPVGWDAPGFDDSTWAAALEAPPPPLGPVTHLQSARTRIVSTPLPADTFRLQPSGAVVADFRTVVAAVPTIHFHAGVRGRRITMHAGYVVDPDGSVSTTAGTQHTDMSYSYVERDGDQTFEPFDYLGFRYLQIDDPGEPLAGIDVVALARHVDVPLTQPATFSSSDAALDAVWILAEHSALNGAQEQFIDTPTREKGPFLRDGFNESEVTMAAWGERNLSRRALLELAASQSRYWPDGRLNAIYPSGEGARDIPDYTEIYPEWVWRYALASGDRATVQAVYPAVVKVTDYLAAAIDPSTGLVTRLPGGGDGDYQFGIVDWPAPMRYGYDMATAARTTENAMAVDAFTRTADLGEMIGAPEPDVAKQRDRARTLTAAMNAKLTRADGTYVDGLEGDGTASSHASEHANAEAVAYGVVPAANKPTIGTFITQLGMAMGPMTVQSLLDALHDTGHDRDLVRLLTNDAQPGWAKILASGGTNTWETWDPSDVNGDSMSHGWGATVAVAMQQALLGITVNAPGGGRLTIAAPGGTAGVGLTTIRGTLPTSRGTVAIEWTASTGDGPLRGLKLTLPPNTTATVTLADGTTHPASSGTSTFP